ncbi:efflux transporter outer membrane subunit [Aquitalea sp. LB_tupeE]|uniref:efflux transporter outer membrane subunit n=1 Tax=Aquitalea sp. LB_tupeE TaxID=2748078 RepID=UPI00351AAC27
MNKPNWQQTAGVLMLTAMLGGCASFGEENNPATPLTASQLQLDPARPGSQVQAGWWQQLADPQLDQLIKTALQQSPSLKVADARLREARSAIGMAESKDGLQVAANASVDRERYSLYGLLPAPIGGNYYDVYTLSLGASWEIDFWGKNRAAVQAAIGNQQAVALEAQQARLTLTQAVIAQYTELQRIAAQAKLLKARQQLAQSQLALTHARVNAGLLPGDSLRQAEIRLKQLSQQDSALADQADHARHALAALSGQPPHALDTMQPPALKPAPAMPDAALTLDMLSQRPDIVAQRARVEAMNASVNAAKAEFYPNVSLSAFIGQSALESGDLLKAGSKVVGITPAIHLPIFTAGALQANLASTRARYDIAVENYNQTVLFALRDAADSLSTWQKTASQLSDAHQATQLSRKASDSTVLRFKAGLVDKLAVLQAEEADLNQQGGKIDATAANRMAWANLNTALGGGFATSETTQQAR